MTTRYGSGDPRPATRQVATRDLRPGMRLLVPPPHVPYHVRVVRTVDRVAESGWRNHHDEPIVHVHYAEPGDDDWGAGNSGLWDGTWHVIDESEPAAATATHRGVDQP